MIIGLTGGTGSGKSMVAKILRENGIFVIDCDKLGHEVLEPGGAAEQETVSAFGKEIIEDGRISRKKLGAIVFADPEKLHILDEITHKHIKNKVEKEIKGKPLAVIDGALLLESGIADMCDRLLVVTAPEEVRIRRIVERDGITVEDAKRRISMQTEENVLTNLADIVIINDSSLNALRDRVNHIIQSW